MSSMLDRFIFSKLSKGFKKELQKDIENIQVQTSIVVVRNLIETVNQLIDELQTQQTLYPASHALHKEYAHRIDGVLLTKDKLLDVLNEV